MYNTEKSRNGDPGQDLRTQDPKQDPITEKLKIDPFVETHDEELITGDPNGDPITENTHEDLIIENSQKDSITVDQKKMLTPNIQEPRRPGTIDNRAFQRTTSQFYSLLAVQVIS